MTLILFQSGDGPDEYKGNRLPWLGTLWGEAPLRGGEVFQRRGGAGQRHGLQQQNPWPLGRSQAVSLGWRPLQVTGLQLARPWAKKALKGLQPGLHWQLGVIAETLQRERSVGNAQPPGFQQVAAQGPEVSYRKRRARRRPT